MVAVAGRILAAAAASSPKGAIIHKAHQPAMVADGRLLAVAKAVKLAPMPAPADLLQRVVSEVEVVGISDLPEEGVHRAAVAVPSIGKVIEAGAEGHIARRPRRISIMRGARATGTSRSSTCDL